MNDSTKNYLKKFRNAAIICSAITAALFVIMYTGITIPFANPDNIQTCAGLMLTIALVCWVCVLNEYLKQKGNIEQKEECTNESCGCRHNKN